MISKTGKRTQTTVLLEAVRWPKETVNLLMAPDAKQQLCLGRSVYKHPFSLYSIPDPKKRPGRLRAAACYLCVKCSLTDISSKQHSSLNFEPILMRLPRIPFLKKFKKSHVQFNKSSFAGCAINWS